MQSWSNKTVGGDLSLGGAGWTSEAPRFFHGKKTAASSGSAGSIPIAPICYRLKPIDEHIEGLFRCWKKTCALEAPVQSSAAHRTKVD